jgi:quercetin dioxygenase-like cupin family protein
MRRCEPTDDRRTSAMPVERAEDHPVFELGASTITSLAGGARGATEEVLFRIEMPPGAGLPPHHHDHLDVFTIVEGGGTVHIDDVSTPVAAGDSAVVPVGARHYVEAGPEGATLVVTMLTGTKLVRDDGTEAVPPWVS